jgi:hypothetical protein
MSKGRTCTICTGENVAQVNALLAANVRLKDIASQTGVSKFALSRHRRNCLAPVSALQTGEIASLENQLDTWMARCEELWNAGAATLDLKSQGQALQQAFRCLEVARKNQERAAEVKAEEKVDSNGEQILTIEGLDRLIAKAETDPRNEPIFLIRCALQRVDDWIFPALCSAVLTFIKNFRPPEPLRAEPTPLPSPRVPEPAPEPEESYLCCPHCQSRSVSVTNGNLRCGACGEQQPLPAGVRLRAEFPSDWLLKEAAHA